MDSCNEMTCDEPVFPTKPGKCPNMDHHPRSKCQTQCLHDDQCHGQQKCCQHSCGKMCAWENFCIRLFK